MADLSPEMMPPVATAFPDAPSPPPPPSKWAQRRKWFRCGLIAFSALFVLLVGWLAITAPLSRSLRPIAPPSIVLLSEQGRPIARQGAIIDKPVDVTRLPPYVGQAFVAIEDRRFRSHWGVDPRGIARAAWHNLRAGHVREGGSTITQQLAKVAFLDADRTAGRKLREAFIAVWLEAWLTKDEILSRYLSNVYFGDNVYGLRAAANHYFSKRPEQLTVAESAMLAGMMKAPSRLAPSTNLSGARDREKLVVAAMAEAGFLTPAAAAAVPPARVHLRQVTALPSGTWFADWAMPSARDRQGEIYAEQTVTTTLDDRLQRAAERAVARAGAPGAEMALVAMRPDGTVVAMVGGRHYSGSGFNRATQARRQPGSTFKLFVYLAALRAGMTPDSMVEDKPVTVNGWSPANSDKHYRGSITLREAFARSSNVAAVRLAQQVGPERVARAARDLGIASPLRADPSLALGTSGVTLLELTSAYAAVAANAYPVHPHGLPDAERGWFDKLWDHQSHFGGAQHDMLLDLLSATVKTGTARGAALTTQAFGKTGTTQDNRDAIFIGFAGDLVTGVWVGRDDNKPIPGIAGGGVPARVWRDFMSAAIGAAPLARQTAPPVVDPDADMPHIEGNLTLGNISIGDVDLGVKLGRDGFTISAAPGMPAAPKARTPDDARPPDDEPGNEGQ